MKRKIAGTAVRIVVSVALIAWVCTRIPLRDRTGIDVSLADGRHVVGEVVSRDALALVVQPRTGPLESLPLAAVRAETPVVIDPGILTVVRALDLGLFVPLLFLWFLPVLINTHRWKVLLRIAGVEVPWRDALRLTYVGIFFNNFMLGSTGGDLLKAYLVAQDTEHKTRAVTSVFVDRLAGILGLVLVALGAIGFNLGRPELREAAILIGAILGSLAVGAAVYFSPWARRHPWVVALLRRLPFEHVRKEIDVALHLYRDHKSAAVFVVAVSAFAHLIAIGQAWGFAIALGVENVQWVHFCSFLPVIFVANALPISVGGLGVGEAAYVRMFAPVGMSASQAVTLSLLGRAMNLVLSLPGGLLLALGKRRGELAEARRAVERETSAEGEAVAS